MSEEGSFIRWAGSSASGIFHVVMQSEEGKTLRYKCDPLLWTFPRREDAKLAFKEADKSSRKTANYSLLTGQRSQRREEPLYSG